MKPQENKQVQPQSQPAQQQQQWQFQPKQKKPKALEDKEKETQMATWLIPLIFAVVIIFNSAIVIYRTTAWPQFSTKQTMSVLQFLKDNTALDPIHSIGQIDTNEATTCPEGYEMAAIDYFPGVASGCICGDGAEAKPFAGTCPAECYQVPSVEAKYLYIYQDKRYCIKRLKDYKLVSKGAPCPGNYTTKCTPFLCVLTPDDCPVTKVNKVLISMLTNMNSNDQLSEAPRPASTKKMIAHNQLSHAEDMTPNVLVYPTSKSIFQYNDQQDELFVGLFALFNKGLCYDQTIKCQFNDGKMYPFIKPGKRTVGPCGPLGLADSYSWVMDQIFVGSYWKQNGIPALPQLNSFMSYNDKIQFLIQKKIPINTLDVCYNVHFEEMTPTIQSYETMRISQFNFSILLFLFGCATVILCLVDIFYDKDLEVYLHNAMAVLGYLCALFSLIMMIIFLHTTINYNFEKVFTVLIENQCFDDSAILKEINASVTFFNRVLNISSQSIQMNFLFSLIFIAFHLWIYFRQKNIHKQVSAQNSNADKPQDKEKQ